MVETQIRVPLYLMREYKKSYKKFDNFFVDLIDLVRYLRDKGYIKNDIAKKWIEGLTKASEPLKDYDIRKALEEAHDTLKEIDDVFKGIKANLFVRREDFPLSLKFLLQEIADSLCGFVNTLLDMVDYYEIINNISLANQSTLSDKYNEICCCVEYGDYDEPITSIINIMKGIEPLIDAIRNQLKGNKGL